jgi:hypothetical protein
MNGEAPSGNLPLSARLAPSFVPVLHPFTLASLEADPGTIIGLFSDLRIGYVNPAWVRFARDNGGEGVIVRWPPGASIESALAGPLRGFIDRAFTAAAAGGPPFQDTYECSSATVERRFLMRIHKLAAGFLVTHSLVVTRPHAGPGEAPDEAMYRKPDGLVVQCCVCRRTRRSLPPYPWDWVPGFVTRLPPRTSHGLCETCVDHYYPTLRDP